MLASAGGSSSSVRTAWLLGIPAGILAAFIGISPWLVSGSQSIASGLWPATSTLTPVMLLPYSEHELPELFAVLIAGWALAGWTLRAAHAVAWRVPVGIGLLVAYLGATVQSYLTLHDGLRPGTTSDLFINAMLIGTVLTLVFGVVVFLTATSRSVSWATVTTSVAVAFASVWLMTFFADPVLHSNRGLMSALTWVHWMPSVIVGVLVAWSGFRGVARTVASIVAVVMIWPLRTLISSLSWAVAGRGGMDDPAALASLLLEGFTYGLQRWTVVAMYLGIAVVVAALVTAVRFAMARSSRTEEPTKPDAVSSPGAP